jgi:hypothetical protein
MRKFILILMTLFTSTTLYAYFCPAGGKLIKTFNFLDERHEQFYCTFEGDPEKDGKQLILYNDAEIISGFDLRGTYRTGQFNELKKYYFDAFHDTASVFKDVSGHLCVIADFPVNCYAGKGGRKERFPGQYG